MIQLRRHSSFLLRSASRSFPPEHKLSEPMQCLRVHAAVNHGNLSTLTGCVHKATFLSFSGSKSEKRKNFSERRIMGFSMEQMFDVVQDVEKYQEFLPWCHSSIVKTRKKGHLTADLQVGIPPVVESYTSSVTLIRPFTIKAESTQGKLFNELINIWKFSPGLKGKPNSCIIDFYVSFEFRHALASQLSHVFFNEVVRAMTGAFYNEAKRRYGQESVPSRKIEIISSGSNNEADDPRKW